MFDQAPLWDASASIYNRKDSSELCLSCYPDTGGKLVRGSLETADDAEAERIRRKIEIMIELRSLDHVAIPPRLAEKLPFQNVVETCRPIAFIRKRHLGEDPRGGTLFVFCNRRRNRLKILYFDGTGLWVMAKRLEEGTFSWPKDLEGAPRKLALRPEALAMLTDGIDLHGARMRPWYGRE